MTEIVFDRLDAVRKLEEAHFPRPHAEAIVEVLFEGMSATVATKADLVGLSLEMKAEAQILRLEMKAEAQILRKDVSVMIWKQYLALVGTITALGALGLHFLH